MRCLPGIKGTERACSTAGGSITGIFIAFLCPLCVPASAALLSATGLTFLPTEQFIYPLFYVFAVVLMIGLVLGFRRHGDISPLLFAVIGLIAIPLGRYIIESAMLAYTGGFCIIAATAWNLVLHSLPRQKLVTEEDIQQLLEHTTA